MRCTGNLFCFIKKLEMICFLQTSIYVKLNEVDSVHVDGNRDTYNGRVHSVLQFGESLVHIDPQGLGEVCTVVVLAVVRVEPLHIIIWDVAPPPQERRELHPMLGGRRPDGLNVVLLPPLHVFGAPLVVNVEESFAGAPRLGVNIAVIELVTNNTV